MKNCIRRILLDALGNRRENGMWRIDANRVALNQIGHLILLGLDGKLGDAVLQSSVIRAINNANFEGKITVVTTPNLEEYWRECAGVSAVFTVRSRSDSTTFSRLLELRRLASIAKAQDIGVLICFDPIPMIDYFAFVRWTRPRTAIGVSAIQYSIFHISINDPIFEVPKNHVAERFVRTLAALGIDTQISELRSIVPRNADTTSRGDGAHISSLTTNFFINGYGASSTRTFSSTQLKDIVQIIMSRNKFVTININVNQTQADSWQIRGLSQEFPGKIIISQSNGGISNLFNKLARAAAVLTPDTSVAHIAAATGTPMAIAYDDRDFNPICWRPLSKHVVRLIPITPGPISRFSALELVDALERSRVLNLTRE